MIRNLFLGLGLLCVAAEASAQSMFPMQDTGVTFTDKRGVMLTVVNPYSRAETFHMEAFQPDLLTPESGVTIRPSTMTLGSNSTRRVRVVFDVPPTEEREIAVCMRLEVSEEAQIVPRVCGRYAGRRFSKR